MSLVRYDLLERLGIEPVGDPPPALRTESRVPLGEGVRADLLARVGRLEEAENRRLRDLVPDERVEAQRRLYLAQGADRRTVRRLDADRIRREIALGPEMREPEGEQLLDADRPRGVAGAAVNFGRGLRSGAIVEPGAAIGQLIGTGLDALGFEEQAERYYSVGEEFRRRNLDGGEGFAGTVGRVGGSILPAAAAMLASGGAAAPILSYYFLQGAGAGVEDYRQTLEARGEDPKLLAQVATGVGYGAAEALFERLGLEGVGRVGARTAAKLGDALFRGNARSFARTAMGIGAINATESAEEAATQLAQNLISRTYDPTRRLTEGVGEAAALGALGGSMLAAPALASPRGRAALRQIAEETRALREGATPEQARRAGADAAANDPLVRKDLLQRLGIPFRRNRPGATAEEGVESSVGGAGGPDVGRTAADQRAPEAGSAASAGAEAAAGGIGSGDGRVSGAGKSEAGRPRSPRRAAGASDAETRALAVLVRGDRPGPLPQIDPERTYIVDHRAADAADGDRGPGSRSGVVRDLAEYGVRVVWFHSDEPAELGYYDRATRTAFVNDELTPGQARQRIALHEAFHAVQDEERAAGREGELAAVLQETAPAEFAAARASYWSDRGEAAERRATPQQKVEEAVSRLAEELAPMVLSSEPLTERRIERELLRDPTIADRLIDLVERATHWLLRTANERLDQRFNVPAETRLQRMRRERKAAEGVDRENEQIRAAQVLREALLDLRDAARAAGRLPLEPVAAGVDGVAEADAPGEDARDRGEDAAEPAARQAVPDQAAQDEEGDPDDGGGDPQGGVARPEEGGEVAAADDRIPGQGAAVRAGGGGGGGGVGASVQGGPSVATATSVASRAGVRTAPQPKTAGAAKWRTRARWHVRAQEIIQEAGLGVDAHGDYAFDRVEQELLEHNLDPASFSSRFAGPIPQELREATEGDAKLRRELSGHQRGGTAEDYWAVLGTETYLRLLEISRGVRGGRLAGERAVDVVRRAREMHPEAGMIAELYEQLPVPLTQLPALEVIERPERLPDGALFTFNGAEYAVYTSLDGTKRATALSGDRSFNLTQVAELPLDAGSLDLTAGAEAAETAQRWERGEFTDDELPPFAPRLRRLAEEATQGPPPVREEVDLGPVSPEVVERIRSATGVDVAGYRHAVSNHDLRHIHKQHGDAAAEARRGQIAVTPADMERLPLVLQRPDSVEDAGRSKRGLQTVRLSRVLDGVLFVVEEIRTGRRQLVPISMLKRAARPPAPPSGPEGSRARTSETFRGDRADEDSTPPFAPRTGRLFGPAAATGEQAALPLRVDPDVLAGELEQVRRARGRLGLRARLRALADADLAALERRPPRVVRAVLREEIRAELDRRTLPSPDAAEAAGWGETPDDADQMPLFAPAPPPDSEAFRRWFGGSVVRNPDGSPRVMYHGTWAEEDFGAFRPGPRSHVQALFFAPDPEVAGDFAGGPEFRLDGGRLIPVYVRAERPFDFRIPEHVDRLMAWWRENVEPVVRRPELRGDALRARLRTGDFEVVEHEWVQQGIRALGFDGFWVHERVGDPEPNIAVYDPAQVKSATGNRGTFDPADPDIRFAPRRRDMRGQNRLPGGLGVAGAADAGARPAETGALSGGRARLPGGQGETRQGRVFSELAERERVASLAWTERWLEKWGLADKVLFDSFGAVKRLQRRTGERVRREAGEDVPTGTRRVVREFIEGGRQAPDVPERVDVYLAEELFHGRAAERVEAFLKKYVEPALDAMVEAKETKASVGELMVMQHAPERNAYIAEVNPTFRAQGIPGSGVATTDAATTVARMRELDPEAYQRREAITRKLRAISEATLEVKVREGLITPEQAARVRARYEFYTPLESDVLDAPASGPSGFDVRGTDLERAMGRTTPPPFERVVDAIVVDAVRTIVRAEKNRVFKTMLAFVREYPDESMYTVDRPPTVPRWNEELGIVEYGPDPRWTQSENVYTGKVNGETVRITFDPKNAPNIAAALRRLDEDALGGLWRALGSWSRFYSRASTQFNPNFLGPNAVRDVGGAAVTRYLEGGAASAGRLLARIPEAFRLAMRAELSPDGMDPAALERVREFKRLGGVTGYASSMAGIEQVAKSTRRHLERRARMTPAEMARHPFRTVVMPLRALADLITRLNQAAEVASRLATYEAALAEGLTPARAASRAKNITLNFNKKGTLARHANALWPFTAVSLGGARRIAQAFWHAPLHRKGVAIGALVGGGILWDWLQALLGGEGEDGQSQWDAVSEFEKSRSLSVVTPGGQTVEMPMPHGYAWLHYFGTVIGRAARGRGNAARDMDALLGAFVQQFAPSPLSDPSLPQAIGVGPLRPFVDISVNADFAGRPITPPRSPWEPEIPNSELFYDDVNPVFRAIARGLNRATGGDAVQPGMVDISPEWIEHVASYLAGGAGQFVVQSVAAAGNTIEGNPPEARAWPIVKGFAGGPSPFAPVGDFYDLREQIRQHRYNAEKYVTLGARERAARIMEQHGAAIDLLDTLDRYSQAAEELELAEEAGDEEAGRRRLALFAEAVRLVRYTQDGKERPETPILHREVPRLLMQSRRRQRELSRERQGVRREVDSLAR